ncbi:RING zinc finger protein, putative [Plasmodium sp. gorilla clade G2]|uniref:RING zinc finger protein, putative n=1 Tax=Plasmodium sp. gorilla clade G2 TaxID=880535 RepID=UPI000D212715|nr:RING zinc finger protein, putative [Plasmodium sp. gorilla clade G2]SOV11435.1 RING zinc finger protein, putative [Plasmodium sp. gorilla clade G2]
MAGYIFGNVQNNLNRARHSLTNTLSDMRLDESYIKSIRMNIKKRFDKLMNKIIPFETIDENKRFVVIIEKKKNYENFRCPICMLILFKPVRTKCGHIFCRECIEKVLLKFDYCPLCRSFIKDKKLDNVDNNFLGSEYENIKIRCYKCKEITNIKNYEKHIINHIMNIHKSNDKQKNSSEDGDNYNFLSIQKNKKNSNYLYSISNNYIHNFYHHINPYNFDSYFNKKFQIIFMNEFFNLLLKHNINTHIDNFYLLYGQNILHDFKHINVEVQDIMCDVFFIIKIRRKKKKKKNYNNNNNNNNNNDDVDDLYMENSKYLSEEKNNIIMSKDINMNKYINGNLISNEEENKKDINQNNFITNNMKKKNSIIFNSYKKKLYTNDTFEMYQKKLLIHNKKTQNKYIYILFEYNTKNIFFTLLQNIPVFKNMNIIKLVKFNNNKMNSIEHTTDISKQLITLFSILNEKRILRTYHKYFYNSIHLFHELIYSLLFSKNQNQKNENIDVAYMQDIYEMEEKQLNDINYYNNSQNCYNYENNQNEEPSEKCYNYKNDQNEEPSQHYNNNDNFIEKIEHNFKNIFLKDYELMFILFYLKYEYRLPLQSEYLYLYSENFIAKILRDQEREQDIFISNVYSYHNLDIIQNENKMKGENILSSGNNGIVNNDKGIFIILKIQRGKLKNQDDNESNIIDNKNNCNEKILNNNEYINSIEENMNNSEYTNKKDFYKKYVQKNMNKINTNTKNINHYYDIHNVCYIIISYSTKGFQWYLNNSVDFLNKKQIEYKSQEVFFLIDKLILFFFNIRNKKYSSVFWNSTHLFQCMLNFCCE